MSASCRTLLVICLALGLAPAAGGCGGHVDQPGEVADGEIEGDVNVAADSATEADATDAKPVTPACQDHTGNCISDCLTWSFYEDTNRNCYERAMLCVPAPLPTYDTGSCGTAGCFVNIADGTIIATCATPSASRWRPCTSAEFASVESIWQECPPPPVHAGEIFY